MKTSIGLCGATGKTPELQIGQVKTVEHTQKASVEITGTRENPILNFNIPKGKDGAKLIVREYFNGDIQILNNLNELPQDTNSDSYGKTVMSVNGIKQLLEKINDVLTKANANTNALGSLTSTVQGNKSDIETKLNNFKSVTDTTIQNINNSISDLEGIIETKLNEELTKQVKALQDENKKLNDKLLSTLIYVDKQGEEIKEDTTKAPIKNILIEGKTVVTDAPNETSPDYKNIESVGEIEGNKIKFLTHGENLFNIDNWNGCSFVGGNMSINNGTVTVEAVTQADCYTKTGATGSPVCSESERKYLINVKPSTQYTLNCDIIGNATIQNYIQMYDASFNSVQMVGFKNNATFTTNDNVFYLGFRVGVLQQGVAIQYKNIILAENDTSYEPYKEEKKEITLPIENGLKSLPDGTKDTIEQRKDGFYLVQRIIKFNLSDLDYHVDVDSSNGVIVKHFTDNMVVISEQSFLSNMTIGITNAWDFDFWKDWAFPIGINTENMGGRAGFEMLIQKRKITEITDVETMKNYFRNNSAVLYLKLKNPIETKISDIDLETLGGINYITTENNIKPNLKLSVSKTIKSYIDEKIGGTK